MIYHLGKKRNLRCNFCSFSYRWRYLPSFTLIELSVVIAVLILFLTLVFPRIPAFKEEKSKSEARKLVGIISEVLDLTLREKKNLKIVIQKGGEKGKVKIMDCVPVSNLSGKEDEKRQKQRTEQIRKNLGELAQFFFSGLGRSYTSSSFPQVCEWKEKKKIDLDSKITSVFVEAEETFGGEVEILFQPTKIPFVEIQLEQKFWVILNPYNFKVFVDEKPAHFGR